MRCGQCPRSCEVRTEAPELWAVDGGHRVGLLARHLPGHPPGVRPWAGDPPACASTCSLAGAVRSGTRLGRVMSGSVRGPQHGQGRSPTGPRPAVPRRARVRRGTVRWAEKRAGRRAGDAARAEGAGPEGRAVGGVLLGAGRRERVCAKFPFRNVVVTV